MARVTADRDTEVIRKARAEFRRHGGLLRMADAVRCGIHRRTLYARVLAPDTFVRDWRTSPGHL